MLLKNIFYQKMNQHLLVHDYDEVAHQAQQIIEQAKVIQELVSSDVSKRVIL